MDISVRYIPTDYIIDKGQRKAAGNKPALCFITPKNAKAIVNNELAVEVIDIDPEEALESRVVPGYEDNTHAISKFVTHLNVHLKKTKEVTDEVYELMKLDLHNPPEYFPEAEPEPKVERSSKKKKKVKANGTATPNIISAIAAEMKLEPTKLRKQLRAAGLSAPYDNEKKIRAALKA